MKDSPFPKLRRRSFAIVIADPRVEFATANGPAIAESAASTNVAEIILPYQAKKAGRNDAAGLCPEALGPYGAGCVTVSDWRVTAVCASSLPFIDAPVCIAIFF